MWPTRASTTGGHGRQGAPSGARHPVEELSAQAQSQAPDRSAQENALSALDWSADFSSPEFWWAVFGIFVVNGLLSGDNAVLIALACRGLPPRERLWGMVIGAGVASVLLIAFTAIISSLMQWPYLRFVSRSEEHTSELQ